MVITRKILLSLRNRPVDLSAITGIFFILGLRPYVTRTLQKRGVVAFSDPIATVTYSFYPNGRFRRRAGKMSSVYLNPTDKNHIRIYNKFENNIPLQMNWAASTILHYQARKSV